MTRVLVWKDLRQQRAIWLVVALAAAAGVATLSALLRPGGNREDMLVGVLWFAAWGYGLVCGSLLLAGETEDGTQGFLDLLPATRRRMWRVKAMTGAGLLLAQLVTLAALGLMATRRWLVPGSLPVDSLGLLFFGVVGYAWGLFCGSFTATVLKALGWALLLQAVCVVVVLPLIVFPFASLLWTRSAAADNAAGLVTTLALAAGATVWSRKIYSRPDRLRVSELSPRHRATARHGFRQQLWLAWRQSRGLAFWLAVLSPFAAATVAYVGVLAWPALTLCLGLACGVTAFFDEQRSGGFRMFGDQRWPLVRLCLAKALVRFAVAAGTAAVTALAVAVLIVVRLKFRGRGELSGIYGELGSGILSGPAEQPFVSLSIWLIYGLTVGHLCSICFRRRVVACAVALLVAAPFAALWLPSVVIGGPIHAWQVWGLPTVFLLATLTVARARAEERLTFANGLTAVSGAVLLSAALTAASLWYRAVEIPAVADAIDFESFLATLPTPEENAGGRTAADGLRQLAEFRRTFDDESRRLPPPGAIAPQRRKFFEYSDKARAVAYAGWSNDHRDLATFLDRLFQGGWPGKLAEAANLPTGVIIDPRTEPDDGTLLSESYDANNFLVARGLQRQAEGDPGAFVENLRIGLALTRNLRRRTTLLSVSTARGQQRLLTQGVGVWLENLDRRPDLLQRALDVLRRHEAEPVPNPEEIRAGESFVERHRLKDPRTLPTTGPLFSPLFSSLGWGEALYRISFQAPWERVRFDRLMDELASYDASAAKQALELAPPAVRTSTVLISNFLSGNKRYPNPEWFTTSRAAMLQVALRLYEAETGRPAEQLTDLVPKYLPSVPADPYDGQPFRYRLSRGEVLNRSSAYAGGAWGPLGPGNGRPERLVAPGQGLLWCVGEDGVDDGGRVEAGFRTADKAPRGDVVTLVPLPPSRR